MILELENQLDNWTQVYSITMVSYSGDFNHRATAAHVYAWQKSIIKIMYLRSFPFLVRLPLTTWHSTSKTAVA